MAPLKCFSFRKVFLLCLVWFLFSSIFISAFSESQITQRRKFMGRRRLLKVDDEEEDHQPKKKFISTNHNNANILSTTKKNQTKLLKPKTNSTKTTPPTSTILTKPLIKKLNSTSNSTQSKPSIISTKPQVKKLNSSSKPSNLTKPISLLTKKSSSSDLLKPITPKNKTTSPINTKQSAKPIQSKPQEKKTTPAKKTPQQKTPSWYDQEDEDDLVSDFQNLPTKFHQTLIPDLEKISTSSKAYITQANNEITKNFKPYFGNKYASTIATITSCTFILLPLLLVSLIFNQFAAYFSLQKILIFIQVYLCIYFTILCLSSLITGLEPLKFFYATSQSTYVWLQVLQTLGYVMYLLLLLMYLVLVSSTDCGLGSKMLGLGQTFVGYAVGLHYYVSVFHRVVLKQPPKTNWKVHGIYATCFLVVCLFSMAERRKKAYLEDDGEEGKKN